MKKFAEYFVVSTTALGFPVIFKDANGKVKTTSRIDNEVGFFKKKEADKLLASLNMSAKIYQRGELLKARRSKRGNKEKVYYGDAAPKKHYSSYSSTNHFFSSSHLSAHMVKHAHDGNHFNGRY